MTLTPRRIVDTCGAREGAWCPEESMAVVVSLKVCALKKKVESPCTVQGPYVCARSPHTGLPRRGGVETFFMPSPRSCYSSASCDVLCRRHRGRAVHSIIYTYVYAMPLEKNMWWALLTVRCVIADGRETNKQGRHQELSRGNHPGIVSWERKGQGLPFFTTAQTT
jgi:hypothetical protein